MPREESLDAFVAALASRGFSSCSSCEIEVGQEKIALYSTGTIPTHAARQLATGWWTSKLGPSFDIEHAAWTPWPEASTETQSLFYAGALAPEQG